MTRKDAAECGTYGGAQAHRRRGEDVCEECRVARNEYMNAYRRSRPDVRKRAGREATLRNRALAELAQRHPDEYLDLLQRVRYDERVGA